MVIKQRTKRKFACAFALVIVGVLMSIYADDGRGVAMAGNSTGSAWAANSDARVQ